MLTNYQIFKEVEAAVKAGDTRSRDVIAAEIVANYEATFPSVEPDASKVVGTKVINGETWFVMGNGSEVKK